MAVCRWPPHQLGPLVFELVKAPVTADEGRSVTTKALGGPSVRRADIGSLPIPLKPVNPQIANARRKHPRGSVFPPPCVRARSAARASPWLLGIASAACFGGYVRQVPVTGT
jgi:hypothetical protein